MPAAIGEASAPAPLPRSERFPIRTAIHYRKLGNSHWYEGRTLNISASGVLFRADQTPSPRTAIEMTFTLSLEGRQHLGGQVICQGEIVRNAPAPQSSGSSQVAATIVRYRIARNRDSQ